ncbi:MAG TPA: CDP-diacylglycerol--serine O-phosphatidyltransferase [Bacteroidales bacterium]|jgi:CDP-diacylglycerol--serine O-phosphatidyltransferase|nr:CDP-diacylglycerol--serine O-phosphatidyltransferase [Bacteroidales bacterium]
MKHIPNLITSLNLVSGFIAIIFASRGDIISASWLIAAAMVFDYLDGFSARLLKAYSELGKELDSLADCVSFGVAPAMIIFHLLSNSVSPDALILVNEDPANSVLMFLPVIMPVCAALRLAKFNLDSTQATTFKGLPTPANAIAVISLIFAVNFSDASAMKSMVSSPAFLLVYTSVLSLLMVSSIPLLSLKIKSLGLKGNEGRYLLVGLILLCFAIFGLKALPLIIPMYIIASVVQFYVIEPGTKI